MSDQQAARVAQDPRVASVERDEVVTAFAQTTPTGVDRVDGELSTAVSGDGAGSVDVDVAVIDTGIDINHPDLNVVGGKNCSTGKSFDDGNGHGTHVAGTIGAEDDGAGVVGVAPGARLWAVRVLNNQGSGTRSSIICGVDWVTSRAATIEVANMSLGGSGTEPTRTGCATGDSYHDAICTSVAAGITYVVAAGNSAVNASTAAPAAYDEVITVSALSDFDGLRGGTGAATCRADQDDTLADFSNFGADVDLIAPGVCIRSTWPGGGYDTISGTSMASPHVAGAAALVKAADPGASPAAVRAALLSATTLDWEARDDRDPVKEPLLSVDAL
jgi:subtilisin